MSKSQLLCILALPWISFVSTNRVFKKKIPGHSKCSVSAFACSFRCFWKYKLTVTLYSLILKYWILDFQGAICFLALETPLHISSLFFSCQNPSHIYEQAIQNPLHGLSTLDSVSKACLLCLSVSPSTEPRCVPWFYLKLRQSFHPGFIRLLCGNRWDSYLFISYGCHSSQKLLDKLSLCVCCLLSFGSFPMGTLGSDP